MKDKYAPQKKYDKENTKQIKLKLNYKTDSDILEKLEEVSNISGYLKMLIRADQTVKEQFKKEGEKDD